LQRLSLFAAAPKDERVAPFQTNDQFPLACLRDHQGLDFALRDGMIPAAFADENAFARRRHEPDDPIVCECIVEQDVGAAQEFGGA
jgi:hypothetical protein